MATVSKRWFSMRDTYAVDVAAGQDDLLILASVLALDLAEDESAAHETEAAAAWLLTAEERGNPGDGHRP